MNQVNNNKDDETYMIYVYLLHYLTSYRVHGKTQFINF